MELNWSTFVLEIINFLILVWILKRFLYKPVLEAIAKRRASIEQGMQAAIQKQQAAQVLQSQYEHRLEDWETEKQTAREQLHSEIEQERQRLQALLQASLQQEREKAQVLAAHQAQEQQHRNQQQALHNAMRFTSKLLAELASPELEARLIARLADQLNTLPAAQRDRLSQALDAQRPSAQVHSAFPLSEAQRASLQQVLQAIGGQQLSCEFAQDNRLLAGARIQLGPWLVQANLADELQTFAEFEHHSAQPLPHE